MAKNESGIAKLLEQLKRDIPSVNNATLKDVALVVGGGAPTRSMDAIAMSLLDSDVEVGQILSALLRCEWASVHALMQQLRSDNMQEQIRRFSESVDHFNVLQSAVINGAERRWQKLLEAEHRSRVLAESRVQWAAKGRVHLYNYFREVPVSAPSRVTHVDEDFLWLKRTPELVRVFSVADRDKSARVRSSDDGFHITVGVHRVENDQVCLSVRDVHAVERELRHEVRLGLDAREFVKLKWRDREIRCTLRDISCGGMRLKLPESCAMRRGEAVSCRWELAGFDYSGEGALCWMEDAAYEFAIGLELKLDRRQQQELHRYIFMQQKQISERLNQLGAPDWLRERR